MLEGENFRELGGHLQFCVEKHDIETSSYIGNTNHAPKKFVGKIFADSPKTAKFVKVFTLESWSYICLHVRHVCGRQVATDLYTYQCARVFLTVLVGSTVVI